MPAEYLVLYLCRDIFHCTPSELKAQDPAEIMKILTCLEAEAQVRETENKKPK